MKNAPQETLAAYQETLAAYRDTCTINNIAPLCLIGKTWNTQH